MTSAPRAVLSLLLASVAGCGGGVYTDPTPRAEAPCGVELLANAGFDEGGTGWTAASTSSRPLVYRSGDASLALTGVEPESPPYLAWLGHVDYETAMLAQSASFYVPARASSLSLSGSVYILTDEDHQAAYDVAFLEIVDESALQPIMLESYSNLDETTHWYQIAASTPTAALQGKKLTLRARAVLDDAYSTDFFFDSLSLVAGCPPR